MNDQSQNILIVDDERTTRELHKILLKHLNFTVLEAENGVEALQIINQENQHIDAILSDIMMPEMNGYELCRKVKDQESTSDTPFIFISTLESLEEKTKGYSYGADDYVGKPLEPKELSFKIKNLIRRRKSNQSLSKEVVDSRDAAMQIMNFYGDLGQILEFYKNSLNAKNVPELADLVFDVTKNFGLHCSLQVNINGEVVNFGDQGEISPLEANIIELARQKERFYSFASRLVINYEDFSLLIKNMPIDDTERTGTLRDSLGVLCNAIEAKLNSLIVESINLEKNKIAGLIQNVLAQTQTTFSNIEKNNLAAVSNLMTNFEDSFVSLGLGDEQENHIRNIVETCTTEVYEAFKEAETLNSLFSDIQNNLDEIRNNDK